MIETLTSADVAVLRVEPDYNAVDICLAVKAAHPSPDAHLPNSPVGRLCYIVAAYMAKHRTDLPAVIPAPMDAVIRTESRHGGPAPIADGG
jgi:hypothetical protein